MQRRQLIYALSRPLGRYTVERATQLSGVPKSTIYKWRQTKVLGSDFPVDSPATWSYRDLVLLRLLAWLRQRGMRLSMAAEKILNVRTHLSKGIDIQRIHATRFDVVITGNAATDVHDDRENLLPSADFYDLLATFNLHEPVDELRSRKKGSLWAPDLVEPSTHSTITPWVLAGDPCVKNTRIPTAAIFALRTVRQLPTDTIAKLYPGLSDQMIEDVTRLEERLRGCDLAA